MPIKLRISQPALCFLQFSNITDEETKHATFGELVISQITSDGRNRMPATIAYGLSILLMP